MYYRVIKKGETLKEYGFNFDKAYTSYLKRAVKTLNCVLDKMNLDWIPVEKNWRLNEKHYGELQGLNKAETAEKYGEEQVLVWRRSYDIAPNPLSESDLRNPRFDYRYHEVPDAELPRTESLKDTIERIMPYWESDIFPSLKTAHTLLVVAHGNSLRGIIKHLKNISDEDIIKLNLPTAVPYVFEFDENLNVANDGTMDNATGSTGMTKSQTLTKGFLTFEVDYFIKNGQDLIARWKKDAPVDVNPETEEFTASRQASAALMDEGADFVSGEGIDRALQASQCLPGEPCGAQAFMAVSGGYSTYKAGTTFDMSYGNMLAGVARQCKIGPVGYLAGVFFETGLSRFHSEYEPDDSRSIDSEGHDYYYGAGALAKVFLNRDLLKGLYAEGSIRYGLMMGDWQSHDIQSDGQTADWDGRAPYLTAHGGLGYMWNVTDNVTADVYAKYFWGHLWGDDGTICGQKFEFDDIYSSRVRTGARLNFKKDETFSWYLGGAWERQFDSKSRGTIYGYDVPSTDLKGNTAIAEAGVFFKPAADSDFSFMLGTTGYFGEKREGVTGHLQVRYEF